MICPLIAHLSRVDLTTSTSEFLHFHPFILSETWQAISVGANSQATSSETIPVFRYRPFLVGPVVRIVSFVFPVCWVGHFFNMSIEESVRIPVQVLEGLLKIGDDAYYQFCHWSGLMGSLDPLRWRKMSGPFPLLMLFNRPQNPLCPRPLGPSLGHTNCKFEFLTIETE